MELAIDQIYNMDCLDGMRMIPDGSIDCIITDPPYLIETQGAGFFGKKQDEYMAGCKGAKVNTYGGERYVMKEIAAMSEGITTAILDEMCRVMKKINIYIFCSQKQIMQYLDYFVTKRKCNWNLICWHKIDPIPACGNKYLSDSEYILFFREKGVRLFGTYNTKHTFYVSKANREDKKKYKHPTCKPVDILMNFIENSCQIGGVILDPYLGSGSTAVAALNKDRHYIGFEINKEFFLTAKNRIETL